MSTDHIREFLNEDVGPGTYKRRAKVRDSLDYTHRVFEETKGGRFYVITTDVDEDEEIIDVTEVPAIPDKAALKEGNRPWVPGGSLGNYVYDVASFPGMGGLTLMVTPRWYWELNQCQWDGEGEYPFINHLTGFESEMEATYEVTGLTEAGVEQLMKGLGATRVSFGGFDD